MLNKPQNLNTSGEHVKPLDIDAMVADAEPWLSWSSTPSIGSTIIARHVLALAAECQLLRQEVDYLRNMLRSKAGIEVTLLRMPDPEAEKLVDGLLRKARKR